MSLLINNTNQPITISKELKLENISRRIKNMLAKTFKDLVEIQKRGVEILWNDPTLTPQEIINSLGEDAIKVFQFHGGLTEYLHQISQIDGTPYTPALPTNAFVIDPIAGTITVTEDPYIS